MSSFCLKRSICFSLVSLTMLSSPALTNFAWATGDIAKATQVPATKSSPTPVATSTDAVRLPKAIKPSAYQLTFEPDLQKFTYTGKEIIEINIAEPTKEIALNSIDLNFNQIELESLSDHSKKTGKAEADSKNEQVHLVFNEQIPAGNYKLHINFDGNLTDQLRGFYRSYYKDNAGEKHWLCSSQMEPADARRMFPCFDEPEFKATFQINALIDPKLVAISNAAVERVSEVGGKKLYTFDTTPRMSTYLMVLVVGDFKSTEERKSCGVPIRVWAPSGQEKMGGFALGAACEIMTYLSDYFGIKFPTKKLDLIAVPDFAPGAMENLGAITFKDSLLLIDEKTGSNFARRSALSVIAHEMAHQWFGDLVTNRWWDDLWLNEAFATWAATKTENALRPEWRIRAKAVADRDTAINIDELTSTRAIHAHVGNPKQASEMFDAITYEKGSAVLRMLEVFVTEPVFQKGVHDYLEAHKFDNATSEDLWQSIGAAAKGVPVSKMMQTWIMQAGFPQLSVSSKDNGKNISISQGRYFLMPTGSSAGVHGAAEGSLADQQWLVPVVFTSFGSTVARLLAPKPVLLEKKSEQTTMPQDWNSFTANAQGSGFYRTQYTAVNRKNISSHFDWLSPEERLVLISDLSSFAVKGEIPVEESLDLMLKVKGEDDSVVLDSLVSKYVMPRRYMDSASQPAYQKLICTNLLPLKKKYGWEERKGEDETIKDLRADFMRILGTFGQDRETIKEANDLYAKYMKDRQSVSADIIGSVLNIVAYNGGEAEYEQMKAALKSAANPQEEKRFLTALSRFRQKELIEKNLATVLSPETRATDAVSILSSLLSDPESADAAWQFLSSNWEKCQKKFPPRFNKTVIGACSRFDNPEREKEIREFFTAHPPEMGKTALSRTLENIKIASLFRQRNEAAIRKWVSQKNSI